MTSATHRRPTARREHPSSRHAAWASRQEDRSTEIWFFLAFGIWIVRMFLATTLYLAQIEPLHAKPLLAFALALLVIGEIRRSQDLRAALGITAAALGGISALSSGTFDLLATAVFVYAARNIDFERIARFAYVLLSVLLVFVVLSALFGIVEDHLWGLEKPGERIRHGLGFRYATFPTHYFLEIVLLYGYLRREKSSMLAIGALFAANAWLFSMTGSRNSFVLVSFFLGFLLVIRQRFAQRLYTPRFQRITAAWAFPAGAALSYLLARSFNWGSPPLVKLNSILSNRLAQTHASLDRYGLTLFGQNIKFMGNGLDAEGNPVKAQGGLDYDYNFIDNSFLAILVNNGIIVFLLALLAFTILGLRSARKNDRYLSAILFVTAIHSLIDPQLLDLTYNVFILLVLSSHLYPQAKAQTDTPKAASRPGSILPSTPSFPTAVYTKEIAQ